MRSGLIRWPWAPLVALGVLGGMAHPARAADKETIAKSRKYLEAESRAKAILFFMHPTASFEKMEYVRTTGVTDPRTRKERKGHYCLEYRFRWKSGQLDDHTTILHASFDEEGKLDAIVGGKTTTFVKPFAAANIVLGAVKEQILEVFEDDTAARRVVKGHIDDKDIRKLLTFLLQREQK
jgi:hypothetical protein